MSMIIKAHFNHGVIVPDTELDLPADQQLEIEVRMILPAEKVSQVSEATVDMKYDITSLPFFGMWADRDDMANSADWVHKEREKWSSRLSGTD